MERPEARHRTPRGQSGQACGSLDACSCAAYREVVIRGAFALLLLPGCSLILDFSDPPAPPDAIGVDAIDNAACSFGEPNDDQAHAFALSPGTSPAAGICANGDRDYYAITVADNQTMTFEILFHQDGQHGDLDEELLDSNGQALARSLSSDDNEKIVCPGTSPSCLQLAAGTYYVDVFGFGDATVNGYTINFSVQ